MHICNNTRSGDSLPDPTPPPVVVLETPPSSGDAPAEKKSLTIARKVADKYLDLVGQARITLLVRRKMKPSKSFWRTDAFLRLRLS